MNAPNKQECLLHNTRLERLANDKHSNSLYQFISYKENLVSWICLQGACSQLFIFFVTPIRPEGLLLESLFILVKCNNLTDWAHSQVTWEMNYEYNYI
jgi:hypothetical protein